MQVLWQFINTSPMQSNVLPPLLRRRHRTTQIGTAFFVYVRRSSSIMIIGTHLCAIFPWKPSLISPKSLQRKDGGLGSVRHLQSLFWTWCVQIRFACECHQSSWLVIPTPSVQEVSLCVLCCVIKRVLALSGSVFCRDAVGMLQRKV